MFYSQYKKKLGVWRSRDSRTTGVYG